MSRRSPLEAGSVSLRLYPSDEPDATAVVDELLRHVVLAQEAGFDGVMTSEHHAGWRGYLPNPTQLAGWALEAAPRIWAAACPVLLPLRPVALVAEETAWLAARFPGRVGVGVASGSADDDFEIVGGSLEGATDRFASGLETLAAVLGGRPGPAGRVGVLLAEDRAVQRCTAHPVPVVSAAMSPGAARRAARVGVGLLFDSLTATERVRQLVDIHRKAGGSSPNILIRRAWVGPPPAREGGRQVDFYRSYASAAAMAHWGGDEMVTGPDAVSVASGLAATLEATGADALNIRVHLPGVSPAVIRAQIEAMAEVTALLRDR